jgi:hypothetical protein
LLRDALIFAPTFGKRRQITGRFAFLQLRQQIDQMMNTAVGQLRARLQQVVKLFVVTKESTD